MFDIAPTELMLVALVALVVIGPKDLPRLMRTVGYWVGRARGVARHFRSGLDEMMRQSEVEEMEKRWATENERIMREHPPEAAPVASWDGPHMGPLPPPPAPDETPPAEISTEAPRPAEAPERHA